MDICENTYLVAEAGLLNRRALCINTKNCYPWFLPWLGSSREGCLQTILVNDTNQYNLVKAVFYVFTNVMHLVKNFCGGFF
jgi:hypothetical protein